MAIKAGYWVDLFTTKLEEDGSATWLQAMPIGEYEHPIHGKISITPERVQEFVDNVKLNVRGQELDIDYDHKARTDEAAGWVKDAQNRGIDGLWLKVDWTKTALQKLKEKAYRYFSPEFDDEWRHPKSGTIHKNVLFGGALTNRPFLKDILPINMSEIMVSNNQSSQDPNEGSKGMTPEQIKTFASKLGLAEDATEDDVVKAFNELEIKEQQEEVPPVVVPETIAAAEAALAEAKKLAEGKPEFKVFAATLEAQTQQIKALVESNAKTEAALQLSEVNDRVTKLNELAKSKGYALSIPARDELTKHFIALGGNKQLSESVGGIAETILSATLVKLGEKGNLRVVTGGGEEKTATERLYAEVKKLTDADKGMSFGDAVSKVADADPELYQEYRDESYANKAGEK